MYEIREYNMKDKKQITDLWIDVCIKEHEFSEWEHEIQLIEECDYEKIVVAVYNGKVVGSMAYKKINDEIAELKRVYIYPEHRGKGLANRLLNEILDIVKKNKYREVIVETLENFKSGRRFYEKNNFILKEVEGKVYNFVLEL